MFPNLTATFSTKAFDMWPEPTRSAPCRPPAFDVSGSLAFLKMEAKIIFAKSALQNSACLPSATDSVISLGLAEPRLSQGILLTGLSYQICLTLSLGKPGEQLIMVLSTTTPVSEHLSYSLQRQHRAVIFLNASVPMQYLLLTVPKCKHN